MIYLDYAATTPMLDKALQIYNEVAKNYFGNSSSLHDIGSTANAILEQSRKTIAQYMNGDPCGVYFTSGGSESNYLAIHSLLKGNLEKGRHILTTDLEHSSIRNTLLDLNAEGYEVTSIPVDHFGRVDLDALEAAIRPDTVLATIHHGNSEIGTVQDLITIGEILNNHDILFHSDCVQTFGKIEIDVQQAKLDSISISSHKIYGPKGVGACYINPKRSWKSVISNTTHERGFRPGTVNVPGIAAFVTAAEEIFPIMKDEQIRFSKLRKKLIAGIQGEEWTITEVEPSNPIRLENIIGICVAGVEGQYMMLECNRHGIAISTGSACSVGLQKPAKTLLSIGKSKEEAKQYIRLSVGKFTTDDEIDETIDVFQKILTNHFHKK